MANDLAAAASGFMPDVSGSGIVMFILAIVLSLSSATATYFIYKWQRNKKNYDVTVYRYYIAGQGTQPLLIKDKGGVFIKKKPNLKRFWLSGLNIGMDPDNIPYIYTQGGRKAVHILQEGLSTVRFVNVNYTNNPGLHFAPGEEDVNWAIAAYRQFKDFVPQKESFFSKHGWAVMWGLTVGATLILFIILFQKLEVVGSIGSGLHAAAQAIKEAAIIQNTAPIIP